MTDTGSDTGVRLADVAAEVAAGGLVLDRAQPRSATHLLLHLREPGTPGLVPGQWFADVDEADRVARRTATTAPPGAVTRPGPHLVVQRRGADRRLPALAALLAVPGTRLVAHRPERRAVVRVERGDGTAVFVKTLRGDRGAVAAATLRHLGAAGLPVPQLPSSSRDDGLLVTAEIPGPTLHDLLPTGAVDPGDLTAVGRLVRRLHDVEPPTGSPLHTTADEVDVTRRAVDLAAAYGLPVPAADGLADAAAALAALPPPARLAPLHRDLHDKQLLRDPGTGAWSLLDLDLLALGDPALDLANLVVHLELRARQGLLDPRLVEGWSAALLAGYGADERTLVAVAAHAAVARVRIDAVYAFRPGGG